MAFYHGTAHEVNAIGQRGGRVLGIQSMRTPRYPEPWHNSVQWHMNRWSWSPAPQMRGPFLAHHWSWSPVQVASHLLARADWSWRQTRRRRRRRNRRRRSRRSWNPSNLTTPVYRTIPVDVRSKRSSSVASSCHIVPAGGQPKNLPSAEEAVQTKKDPPPSSVGSPAAVSEQDTTDGGSRSPSPDSVSDRTPSTGQSRSPSPVTVLDQTPSTGRSRSPSPEAVLDQTPSTGRSRSPTPVTVLNQTTNTGRSRSPSPEAVLDQTPSTGRSRSPSPVTVLNQTTNTGRSRSPTPVAVLDQTPNTGRSRSPSPEAVLDQTPNTGRSRSPSPVAVLDQTPNTGRSRSPTPEAVLDQTPNTGRSRSPSPEAVLDQILNTEGSRSPSAVAVLDQTLDRSAFPVALLDDIQDGGTPEEAMSGHTPTNQVPSSVTPSGQRPTKSGPQAIVSGHVPEISSSQTASSPRQYSWSCKRSPPVDELICGRFERSLSIDEFLETPANKDITSPYSIERLIQSSTMEWSSRTTEEPVQLPEGERSTSPVVSSSRNSESLSPVGDSSSRSRCSRMMVTSSGGKDHSSPADVVECTSLTQNGLSMIELSVGKLLQSLRYKESTDNPLRNENDQWPRSERPQNQFQENVLTQKTVTMRSKNTFSNNQSGNSSGSVSKDLPPPCVVPKETNTNEQQEIIPLMNISSLLSDDLGLCSPSSVQVFTESKTPKTPKSTFKEDMAFQSSTTRKTDSPGSTSSNNVPAGNTSSNNVPAGNTSSNNVPASNTSSNNVPAGNTSSNNVPAGNTSSNNVPAGNTSSNNVPAGNTSSNNVPAGNTSSNNVPVGNTSSNNVPAGNTSSNNVPAGNTSSNNVPAGNTSSNNVPAGNTSSNNVPAGNTSSNNVPEDIPRETLSSSTNEATLTIVNNSETSAANAFNIIESSITSSIPCVLLHQGVPPEEAESSTLTTEQDMSTSKDDTGPSSPAVVYSPTLNTSRTPSPVAGSSPTRGRSTSPSTVPGSSPTRGRSTSPSSVAGSSPTRGRSTSPSPVAGSSPTRGRSTSPSPVAGSSPTRGRSTSPSPVPGSSPTRGRSTSPSPVAESSPTRGRSTSPSPVAGSSPTRGRSTSPSPVAESSPTRGRSTSPSPVARSSPTRGRSTSPSPVAGSSPTRGRSTSPSSVAGSSPTRGRSTSPSPVAGSSPTRGRSTSPSPVAGSSPTRGRSTSPSPVPGSSPTRGRSTSPSPVAESSPTRGRSTSPSPVAGSSPTRGRSTSPSPVAESSPTRGRSTSPSPVARSSPTRGRSTSPSPVAGSSPTRGRSTSPSPVDESLPVLEGSRCPSPDAVSSPSLEGPRSPSPVDESSVLEESWGASLDSVASVFDITSSLSPDSSSSPTPVRSRTPSPVGVPSPTPVRSRTPSTVGVPSPTPVRSRTPSTVGVSSPTPVRSRSPSTVGVPSPTPVRSRTPSTVGVSSPTPVRSRSPSTVGVSSPTPVRSRSPSPVGVSSPTPVRSRSPSPVGVSSPTPVRSRSPSPVGASSPTSVISRSPSADGLVPPLTGGSRGVSPVFRSSSQGCRDLTSVDVSPPTVEHQVPTTPPTADEDSLEAIRGGYGRIYVPQFTRKRCISLSQDSDKVPPKKRCPFPSVTESVVLHQRKETSITKTPVGLKRTRSSSPPDETTPSMNQSSKKCRTQEPSIDPADLLARLHGGALGLTPTDTRSNAHRNTVITRAATQRLIRRSPNHALLYISNKRMELFKAVENGDLDCVQELIQDTGPAIRRDVTNCTLLHTAATYNQLDIVMFLLKLIGPNVVNKEGQTPAHLAALKGHTQVLRILLADHQLNHNKRDNNNRTYKDLLSASLFEAVVNSDRSRVQELLKLGADPDYHADSLVDGVLERELQVTTARQLALTLHREAILRVFPKEKPTEEPIEIAPSLSFSPDSVDLEGTPDNQLFQSLRLMVRPALTPALGPDVYRMDTDPKGYVCILGYSSFEDRPDLDLEGTQPDVHNWANVFGKMGYTGHAHCSLTADQTKQVLTRVRDMEELDQVGCAIFIISSHGIGEGRFLTRDMKLLNTEWICDLFKDSECPRLKNKPKLFIFDFCCGYYKDQSPRRGATGKGMRVEEPLQDMMCLYSSNGGFTSYTFTKNGTPFTMALCRTLAQHAHDKEFGDLYREFLKEYSKTSPATIPQLRNIGFTKRFYFSPVTRRL